MVSVARQVVLIRGDRCAAELLKIESSKTGTLLKISISIAETAVKPPSKSPVPPEGFPPPDSSCSGD
jgi:hypothetical protein